MPGADPEGPLARGLAKLADVLGVDPDEALEVDLGDRAGREMLEPLRAAAAERRQVELDYYAYGRDERTRRVVDPWPSTPPRAQWYLAGWCHLADGPSGVFRVDRIRAVDAARPSRSSRPADAGRRSTVVEPRPPTTRASCSSLDAAGPLGRRAVPGRGGRGARRRAAAGCTLRGRRAAVARALLLGSGPAATVVEGRRRPPATAGGDAARPGPGPATAAGSRRPSVTTSEPTSASTPTTADRAPSTDDEAEAPVARIRNVVEWVVIIVGALARRPRRQDFLSRPSTSRRRRWCRRSTMGDRVLVNKLSYELHDVNRGDIVVFERPPRARPRRAEIKDLIKRVVGLPGDDDRGAATARCCINGEPLDEPYLDGRQSRPATSSPPDRSPRATCS